MLKYEDFVHSVALKIEAIHPLDNLEHKDSKLLFNQSPGSDLHKPSLSLFFPSLNLLQ